MRALACLALALASACTYPEKEYSGPFTCLGQPAPTKGPLLLKIGGHTADPSNLMPVAGASVTLQNAQMNPVFPPATTDQTGAFSFTFNSNGTAVDGIDLYATASGHVPVYYYPTRILTADLDAKVALLTTSEAQSLAAGAGITVDATHGAALLTINDCNGMALAGAVVSASPPATVRYFNGVQPSMTATSTDSGGVAMVGDVASGLVTIEVTVDGMTLPSHPYVFAGGAFVQADIEPAR